MPKEFTQRGFAVYVNETEKEYSDGTPVHPIQVCESSLAFEGPHVRIYGGRPVTNDPDHVPSLHLSYDQAQQVIEGLVDFCNDAADGKLTEKL